jgi:glycosyltransferase involved in cell wall biosynthesis
MTDSSPQKPKISVILSTYSRNHGDITTANLLRRALDSVLAQTYTDFEFIVIDDASEDGSRQVVEEYAAKDSRIVLVKQDRNSGAPAVRYNQGIEMAKGELIYFAFDDDALFPNCLETFVKMFEADPSADMIAGLCTIWDMASMTRHENFGTEPLENLEFHNIMGNGAVCLKRSIFMEIGGHDERLAMRRLCDWEMWWRIWKKGYKIKRVNHSFYEQWCNQPDSVGLTMGVDIDVVVRIRQDFNRPLPFKGHAPGKGPL